MNVAKMWINEQNNKIRFLVAPDVLRHQRREVCEALQEGMIL
jgi:hypothetical protein